MTIPFNDTIPKPSDLLSVSQGDLLNNNKAITEFWEVNHGTMSSLTDRGLHTLINFLNFSAPGAQTYPKSALHTADRTTFTDLNFLRGDGKNRQLTDLATVTLGSAKGIVTPWGFTLNFGEVTVTVRDGTIIPFPINFGDFPISILVTAKVPTRTEFAVVKNVAPSVSQFTIMATNNNNQAYYLAIGVSA